jgi:hypothetical protein
LHVKWIFVISTPKVEDLEGEICGIQLDSATKDLLEKAEVISKDGEDYIFFFDKLENFH